MPRPDRLVCCSMAEQGRGAVPALQCAGQQQQQQQQQQEEEALLVLLGSATGILPVEYMLPAAVNRVNVMQPALPTCRVSCVYTLKQYYGSSTSRSTSSPVHRGS
jgi:hypothetical protein